MAKLEDSLPYVLKNEAGWSNRPEDGATMFGVTQKTLAMWRRHPVSAQDVRDLEIPEVTDLYRALFWNILSLDDVNSQAVATSIFDVGVNAGVVAAAKMAQETCVFFGRNILLDGKLGSRSIEAINSLLPTEFITEFEKLDEANYQAIAMKNPKDGKFLAGWIKRAKRLLNLS